MVDETSVFPSAIVTVDVVLFALAQGGLRVLLPHRASAPYAGARALPGGYIHVQSDVDVVESARRILAAKAGLLGGYVLEQFGVFSGLARDPRGWSLSVAFYAVASDGAVALADFVDVDALPSLPFDHRDIVSAAVSRIRGESGFSALPAFMLPGEFTISDFRQVYERVMGVFVDPSAFRRRLDDSELLTAVEGRFADVAFGRPAQMYRLSDAVLRWYGVVR